VQLALTGRHVAITPVIRRAVERSLSPLTRRLNDRIVSVQVVIAAERSGHHVEVALHARGGRFLHATGAGHDLAEALAAATAKMTHQAQTLKSRWTEGKRRGAPQRAATPAEPRERPGAADAASPVRIVRIRRRAPKPLSLEDAALDVGAEPGAVLVFRNAGTDRVNVLLRRPDGHLGLIEPES
jgi:putative sigma-54 modulation protein